MTITHIQILCAILLTILIALMAWLIHRDNKRLRRLWLELKVDEFLDSKPQGKKEVGK